MLRAQEGEANTSDLPDPWIIEETGLETIGHVQCIVNVDRLRAFFNMVEPCRNL